MASFYDTPAQASFVNTYVPIPFEEIVQAGTARQSRYDDALAAMEQNQSYLESLSAIPGQQQSYLSNAIRNYNQIAEEYASKDLSNTFIRRQLRDKVRGNINPTVLNNITKSYENYQNAQKQALQLDVAGKYFRPYEETMDPAMTGQLSPYEVYNYMPTAFQDPDEMIINRFRSLPVADNTTLEGGKLMRTQSNIDAINQTFDETVRGIKDTPQGEWIIRQAKANGTYTGDDFSTVAAYVESLKPEFTINNRSIEGFAPGYDPKSVIPFGRSPLVSVPGKEEEKPKSLINFGENKRESNNLYSEIQNLSSMLANTKNETVRNNILQQIQEKENTLHLLTAEKQRIENESGLTLSEESYASAKAESFNKIKELAPDIDMDIVEDVGKYKYSLPGKDARKANMVTKYVLENYPHLTSWQRNAVEQATRFYTDELQKQDARWLEKKQGWKESVIPTEDHPGYIPPKVGFKNGMPYYLDPNTGDLSIPANTPNLIEGIRTNPESFALSTYNTKTRKWETIKDTKDSEDFNAGQFLQYTLFPVMPSTETGNQQLEFRVVDQNGKLSNTNYRISLNDPTQLQTMGIDYLNLSGMNPSDPNFTLGYRLMRNNIASTYAVNKNKKSKIPIPMITGAEEEFVNVIKNNDGTYSIQDFNGSTYTSSEGKSKFTTDEELLNNLYDIQLIFDPLFK